MPTLKRRPLWLPIEVHRQLEGIARQRGLTAEELLEEAVSCYVGAAGDDIVMAVPITREVYRIIQDYCSEMDEDEVALVAGEVSIGMYEHADNKQELGHY